MLIRRMNLTGNIVGFAVEKAQTIYYSGACI